MQLLLSKAFPRLGCEEPSVLLGAPVFADSDHEAREAVAVFETCPVRDRAVIALPYTPMPLSFWYDSVMMAYPSADNRFAADNMWTTRPVAELLPALRTIVETMPPHPSHVLWLNWGPPADRPDIANDLEAPVYLALYGQWEDESDDERYAGWAGDNMRTFAHLSAGVQLADENLGERWADFASPASMDRLDRARAQYDPGGLFHSWPGRP